MMTTEEILNLISENSNKIFFSYDIKNGRFLYLSSAFEHFFNLSPEQPSLEALKQLISTEDLEYIVSCYNSCIAGNPVESLECKFWINDNKMWLRISPVLIPEKSLIVGLAEDITSFKEYNEVLHKYASKKNAILNILSHDLAGPLGVIQNMASVVNKELAKGNKDKIQEYITLIQNTGQHCTNMIKDFVNKEFLDSVSVSLVKRRVNMVTKFEYLMQEYRHNQQLMGIDFEFHNNAEAIYANVDEDKFFQVINNLILNSLKFTPRGGLITIDLAQSENTILIKIIDTGIGIPKEFHDILFDKFTKARRTGLNGEVPVGLGMSVIKTIIDWHGFKIWFDSEVDKGTTFYIEMPASE